MKKLLFLAVICLGSLCTFAATGSEYVIDDQRVDQMFSNSLDVSLTALTDNQLLNATGSLAMDAKAGHYRASDKNFLAAFLLDFFLGGFGIHRIYLGTATMTWIGYILTCGGIFGIVPFVDLIVMIIHNDDLSPYVDNTAFFMWAA
jgi:TM2 domain-containing membrane protein YozV